MNGEQAVPEVKVASDDEGRVVTVTIPGGPMSARTAHDLVAVASDLHEQRGIAVIVIQAGSTSFCSGPGADLDPLSIDPDPAAMWSRLRSPIVAAIGGSCRSVGLELALVADIRVAGVNAAFAFPDLAEGRLPCWGGTQRLSRAIRPSTAGAMILLGTELSATEAQHLGLVHQVADDPSSVAAQLSAELVQRGPLSLEMAKEAVHRGAELPLRDGLRLEGDLNHQLAATDDRAEGLQAFFDKRPPDFAGR